MAITEAEQKIRFVVTMFRILAWPLAVLFVPVAIFTFPLILYRAMFDPNSSLGTGLLLSSILVMVAAFPLSMLWIAGRLDRGDPTAKSGAIVICAILLFTAFPISAIAAFFFASRLENYYEEYCRQQA